MLLFPLFLQALSYYLKCSVVGYYGLVAMAHSATLKNGLDLPDTQNPN